MSQKHHLVEIILVKVPSDFLQHRDAQQINGISAQQSDQRKNDIKNNSKTWTNRTHIFTARRWSRSLRLFLSHESLTLGCSRTVIKLPAKSGSEGRIAEIRGKMAFFRGEIK